MAELLCQKLCHSQCIDFVAQGTIVFHWVVYRCILQATCNWQWKRGHENGFASWNARLSDITLSFENKSTCSPWLNLGQILPFLGYGNKSVFSERSFPSQPQTLTSKLYCYRRQTCVVCSLPCWNVFYSNATMHEYGTLCKFSSFFAQQPVWSVCSPTWIQMIWVQ